MVLCLFGDRERCVIISLYNSMYVIDSIHCNYDLYWSSNCLIFDQSWFLSLFDMILIILTALLCFSKNLNVVYALGKVDFRDTFISMDILVFCMIFHMICRRICLRICVTWKEWWVLFFSICVISKGISISQQ